MKKWLRNTSLFLSIAVFVLVGASCGGGTSSQPANEYISSTDPADGATGVDFFAPIKVVFSRDVDESTLTAANVKLTTANGVADVPGDIAYDAATRKLTFTPNFPYWADALYSLSISSAVVTKALGDSIIPVQMNFSTSVRPVLFLHDPTPSTFGEDQNLWSMNADGTNMTALTTNVSPLFVREVRFGNSWSPGYQYVAYELQDTTPALYTRDLVIAASGGSNAINMTAGLSEGHLSRPEDGLWAPDASAVYFTYYVKEFKGRNLYKATPDGTVTELTTYDYTGVSLGGTGGQDIGEDIRISSDGTRLIYRLRDIDFSTPTPQEQVDLYVIELDAADPTSSSHLLHGGDPTKAMFQQEFLPDGSGVYFRICDSGSAANCTTHTATFNADRTAITDPVPFAIPDAKKLRFSPDATSITYLVSNVVWLANADGSSPVQIYPIPGGTVDPNYAVSPPLWSPDGSLISFGVRPVAYAFDAQIDIHVYDVQAGTATNLTNFATGFSANSERISWSTDSTQLMFSVADFATSASNIYKVGADGSNLTNLTNVAGESFGLVDWWQPVFNNITK